ncbi:MAG: AAA family ATPase [Limisphaerales bacterium]
MPDSNVILKPEELQPAAELARKTLEQLDLILLGRKKLHRLVLIGILSRGHILLEGLPGLGKTALVRTIGQILKLDFKRIQFTPDLMPGDVLGTHIFAGNFFRQTRTLIPARPGVHKYFARGRNQSRLAQDAIGHA